MIASDTTVYPGYPERCCLSLGHCFRRLYWSFLEEVVKTCTLASDDTKFPKVYGLNPSVSTLEDTESPKGRGFNPGLPAFDDVVAPLV